LGQLRKTVQREILDKLDAGCFTSSDFDIAFKSNNEKVIFKIVFKHDTDLYYQLEKHNHFYYVRMSPGGI